MDCADPPLALRLFGPFEARLHGRPLPRLRTRKGHWLLALLALRPGAELARDWLASTLWPQSAPAMALTNLRGSLQDLRRALGAESVRLQSPTRSTLSFDLSGAQVDVLTFDAAVARGELSSLQQAISLYRGPLLEECAEEWAFPERQVREQAYLRALENLASDALAAGDLAMAEHYLRLAVAVDPHRESAQRELMQVLAGGGNYGAALQTYRDLRLRLHRELNVGPDPQTQRLFEQIRARAQAAPIDPPPRGSQQRCPGNIPMPPTPLLGRLRELEAIREVLRSPAGRLLTLTGPGGTGKTRLALQVALELCREFRDGAFLINLAPVRDPDLVASTIAPTLGVREQLRQSMLETLKEHLRERQMLLVLDNFEQLLPAAPMVAELLAAAPQLKVLVTSRAPLHVRGEKLLPIPPLELPDRRCPPPLLTLSQYAAVQLFIQRAQDVRPGFTVTTDNAPAVAEICYQLDGLPLAIELAAARTRLLPPQALLARLSSRLSLLTGGARDLPARQRTLRDTIAWSYDLLDEPEKTLFRRLSVFVGGCTLEAAEAVCGAGGDLDVVRSVSVLLDQSLVGQEEGVAGEPRIVMLETIREFSRECLAGSGEETALRQQHAVFFLNWAEAADEAGWAQEGARWLDLAEQEHANLRTALAWALDQGCLPEGQDTAEMGLRLGAALSSFWAHRGHRREAREWLMRLLSLPKAGPLSPARARGLEALSKQVWALGDQQEGLRLGEESLALWRQLQQRPGIARTLYFLGWGNHIHDRLEIARVQFEESLALSRELGDKKGVALLMHGFGGLSYRMGDLIAARQYWEEGVALSQELGDRAGMCGSLSNLVLVAICRDEHANAQPLCLEWLRIAQELGDDFHVARALRQLGVLAYAEGELEAAQSWWEQALEVARQQEDRPFAGVILTHLGGLVGLRGELPTARAFLEEALVIARGLREDDLSRPQNILGATLGLAEVACAEGNLTAAREGYEKVLTDGLERRVSTPPRFGPTAQIARSLEGLAKVAVRQGEMERAARGFGAAAKLRLTLDRRLALPEAKEFQCWVDRVRSSLGEEAFATAWELGQTMSLEEAVADLVEERRLC